MTKPHILALALLTLPAQAREPAQTTATVATCFTPVGPAHCAAEIAQRIDAATVSVHVQAYSFTSTTIIAAIGRAHKRGLDVQVILDKSNETGGYSGLTFLRNAGVPVWIDYKPAIAHNKVVILDASSVVTGSFNFTAAADARNAENFVVLGSRHVARHFEAYFQGRRAESRVVE